MQEHFSAPPVPQLDPGSGKTKKAYLWAYRSNDLQPGPKIIVFDYQAGRGGRHAQAFLQDWQGDLLVDDKLLLHLLHSRRPWRSRLRWL